MKRMVKIGKRSVPLWVVIACLTLVPAALAAGFFLLMPTKLIGNTAPGISVSTKPGTSPVCSVPTGPGNVTLCTDENEGPSIAVQGVMPGTVIQWVMTMRNTSTIPAKLTVVQGANPDIVLAASVPGGQIAAGAEAVMTVTWTFGPNLQAGALNVTDPILRWDP